MLVKSAMGVKESVHTKLLDIYEKYGMQSAIQVGFMSLGSAGATANGLSEDTERYIKTNMNGEISESVLEIILTEYMKLHPDQTRMWHLSKGLILKNPTRPRSRFMTELDLTLFTPKCVYVFECKSYSGDKRIVSKGTILRLSGNSCDAFKQNAIHLETLHQNIQMYSKSPVYQMRLFDFSRGSAEDTRAQEYKEMFEYNTISNVLKGFSTGADVWDMSSLLPAVGVLERASDRLRPEHLRYVKELHNK